MKITIEVEPVIQSGTITDRNYYAFRVVGMDGKFSLPVVMRCPEALYPGNDAMREFINHCQQTKDSK